MNEKLLAAKKELQCRNRVLVHLYDIETGDLFIAGSFALVFFYTGTLVSACLVPTPHL